MRLVQWAVAIGHADGGLGGVVHHRLVFGGEDVAARGLIVQNCFYGALSGWFWHIVFTELLSGQREIPQSVTRLPEHLAGAAGVHG